MLTELREPLHAAVESFEEGSLERDAIERIANILDEPTSVQGLALASLMRDRPHSGGCSINTEPFDLPNGWWLVTFTLSGFTCGIAPDGSVSS